MAGKNMVVVTDASFDAEVLQSDVPVLLDFGAEWCGPCKAISPVLDELAGDYEGKVKVAYLDIDESPKVPANLGVRGIPTVILFKGGDEVSRQVGAHPKAKYDSMIQEAL